MSGRPPNNEYRSQRLYLRTKAGMKAAKRILLAHTAFPSLSNEDQKTFLNNVVREELRERIDARMDFWVPNAKHDYKIEAKEAILSAVEKRHEMFTAPGEDESVPSELVYESFYE